MSSQEHFQRVTDLIIKPIERHYACQFDSDTIADFVDDLGRYPKQILEAAMGDIRRSQKRRPALATIIEACKQNRNTIGEKDTSTAEAFYANLMAKYEKATTDAMSYTEAFMTGSLGLQASAEGWGKFLRSYVFCQASLQAHMLDRLNAGYDSEALYNIGFMQMQGIDHEAILERKRRELYFAKQQSCLHAEPPADMIAEWKIMAKWQYAESEKVAA